MNVRRFETRESLNAALAERLKLAIENGNRGAIMLSGGHAPQPAYRMLGAQALRPAVGLTLFYSDDRYVPPTSEASNYHASLPMLCSLALHEERVKRVRTELPLEEAAVDYERQLQHMLESGTRVQLGLLGMGADGHTASLFSANDLDRARGRLAIAVQRPDGLQAVSVTPELLQRIDALLMVVVGQEKHASLEDFIARRAGSVAWQAVAGNQCIETWTDLRSR